MKFGTSFKFFVIILYPSVRSSGSRKGPLGYFSLGTRKWFQSTKISLLISFDCLGLVHLQTRYRFVAWLYNFGAIRWWQLVCLCLWINFNIISQMAPSTHHNWLLGQLVMANMWGQYLKGLFLDTFLYPNLKKGFFAFWLWEVYPLFCIFFVLWVKISKLYFF